jgi:uncharacterized protein (DUF952 family)
MTRFIFHLTTPEQWQQAQVIGFYRADSLEYDGFIHASPIEQVIAVANAFYRSQSELMLLCLDPDRLTSEIRWESPVHPASNASVAFASEVFPHIYGPINLDAVQDAIALSKDKNQAFFLPQAFLSAHALISPTFNGQGCSF